ncbi:DivIVA domain-containing protein [Amycolatopsis echigonensis]|uniref:Cell wall synthesis protein Wag31 n=1 Tax=Amycolatopsis echigonensis TaxID=2576905 RepID=A0A2N3WJV5_9PSEU|nr:MULTISPECIES: DivIVA domain-containing protein [Amycolatopsis]MBB2501655.1 DivIVA domain-containing protein [Amycolatopsis echigonensis]PKV94147.1 DivIVA domain-containing protein [Amycolatopsis niigatensis]
MPFTAEDLAEVAFGNAPIGRRGYAKHEVDDFVRRIAKTLADEDDLTAAEVHHVLFSKPLIGKRGYDEREVDQFLDEVETQLAERSGRRAPMIPGSRDPGQATAGRAAWPVVAEAPVEEMPRR